MAKQSKASEAMEQTSNDNGHTPEARPEVVQALAAIASNGTGTVALATSRPKPPAHIIDPVERAAWRAAQSKTSKPTTKLTSRPSAKGLESVNNLKVRTWASTSAGLVTELQALGDSPVGTQSWGLAGAKNAPKHSEVSVGATAIADGIQDLVDAGLVD